MIAPRHKSPPLSLHALPALLLPLALAACSPRVFEGSTAKVIEPSAPVVAEAPKEEPRVEVTDDKIVIREKVQFDYNKATIRSESDDLLAEVASVMNQNPRIKKIRVEGHASSEGDYKHNVDLSKRRAKAVLDHLVKRGKVDKGRLESEGYGPDRPIADNDTESGREANRRVEFTILEQEFTETTTTVDPETGEASVETTQKVE
ncbi:OmpA family protein [Pseudenhygromyxa sp. WMMC2535]|uniref:OmpA family protein n=1 Tax=Pseudenhygromyxa sp. WMMC2535 TaxID=2712867 RepID=UPI0015568556|nr:OmpA family protein [Pseudenhygromyxa sp. WMMC2535]NVB39706.1 OmpA family protein [Pseudenhygromyxa sp. WMMC2535]